MGRYRSSMVEDEGAAEGNGSHHLDFGAGDESQLGQARGERPVDPLDADARAFRFPVEGFTHPPSPSGLRRDDAGAFDWHRLQ